MATTGQKPFTRFQSLLTSLFDSQPFPFPANRNREDCPHWLLALTISFSRSDRAHTDPAGVGAGCPKGLFQTYCNCRKVSFGRRKTRGPTRRACHLIRCAPERQRVQARKGPTQGASPGRPLLSMVPARPARPADPHSGLTWASPFGFRSPATAGTTPAVACGEPLRPSARHPVSGCPGHNRLSAPALRQIRAQGACAACGPPRPTAWHVRASPACCIAAVAWP
jgi:hypothetical protein